MPKKQNDLHEEGQTEGKFLSTSIVPEQPSKYETLFYDRMQAQQRMVDAEMRCELALDIVGRVASAAQSAATFERLQAFDLLVRRAIKLMGLQQDEE